MPQVIFPSGYQVEVNRLRQQLDEAHFAFWRDWKAREPEFKIENIRFRHDPQWRERFWSIQSAHSGNHWIWKATRIFMMGTGQVI
jgi:hypothetical protein